MRYRTHDIIEVTNYFKSTPTIKFIGRNNKISDVVGEKVSEIFCIKILEKLEAKYKLLKYNAFFYISKNKNIFNYNFAIYSSNNDLKIKEINNFIKSNFQNNLYYNQAVRLKQIDNLKTHFISDEFYQKTMTSFFVRKKIKDYLQENGFVVGLSQEVITYTVYIVNLVGEKEDGTRPEKWVYVGETSKSANERLEEHRKGTRSNKYVQRNGEDLNHKLMKEIPNPYFKDDSLFLERLTAEKLRKQNYLVEKRLN